ncbi:hypothetical protein J4462_03185 [Candidatus Pacearchaeota archaeon]|nr:hypothetical protein [Candidatus Pacearchaeota archaeon]
MEQQRNFEISGVITEITPYEEGYSGIEIVTTNGVFDRVRIVYFGILERTYLERNIDFNEAETPNGPIYQKITGSDFKIETTATRDQVNKFRIRANFVPQKELIPIRDQRETH